VLDQLADLATTILDNLEADQPPLWRLLRAGSG
jgi:hypothetical protein